MRRGFLCRKAAANPQERRPLLVIGETPWTRTALDACRQAQNHHLHHRRQNCRTCQRRFRRRHLLRLEPGDGGKTFPQRRARRLFNLVQAGGNLAARSSRKLAAFITAASASSAPPARRRRRLAAIPATAEIRPNDKINIIGAAGPMGTMHVIRDLCQGVPGVSVFAGDLSDERLAALQKLAEPLAAKEQLTLRPTIRPRTNRRRKFNYIVLMAPVPALVAAGRPGRRARAPSSTFSPASPPTKPPPLIWTPTSKSNSYFIGTSGSTLDDMKLVLDKVVSRRLDTNLSVAAISGLDGAIDGIRAVEKNLMPGKIIVYPSCHGSKLTPLTELARLRVAASRRPLEQAGRRGLEKILIHMNLPTRKQDRHRHRWRAGFGPGHFAAARPRRLQCRHRRREREGRGDRRRHCQADGRGVLALKTDVTREADVQRLFERAVQEFGRVDIVVANAAILIAEPIADADAEKWRAVMNVNLFGYFLVDQTCLPPHEAPGRRRHYQYQFQVRQERQRRQLRLRRQQFRRHRPHPERRSGNGPASTSAATPSAPAICSTLPFGPTRTRTVRPYLQRRKSSRRKKHCRRPQAYIEPGPMKRGCTYEDVCNARRLSPSATLRSHHRHLPSLTPADRKWI